MTIPITTYPLAWPVGWKRTKTPQPARYDQWRSIATARDELMNEVRRLGGDKLIISSNLELRNDGLPRSGQRQPDDIGVAVYFNYKRKPMCFACDKWLSVEDNIWAIVKTIEAIRSIERAGSSDMMERAFTGFNALPAPRRERPWHEVLNVSSSASLDEIKTAYRSLVKTAHPDVGGDTETFIQIQAAYEAALKSNSKE